MTDPALDQRIQVLEDIEAIRRLKARYCACCDDDHDVVRAGPVVWVLPTQGVAGRAGGDSLTGGLARRAAQDAALVELAWLRSSVRVPAA